MVVGFFMILMLFIFCVASFFAVLNLVFIIIWKVKKHRGRTPPKRYLVIPSIFLSINLLLLFIPVAWVGIIRINNTSAVQSVVKAESGKMVYWNNEDETDPVAGFIMDGINFVEVDCSDSDTMKLGKPIANIEDDPSTIPISDKISAFIFGGNSNPMDTLYPVTNEKGYEIYTADVGTYCPESQEKTISAYYNDLLNYDTLHCRYEYDLNKNGTDGNKRNGPSYDTISGDVTLREGAFDQLYQYEESDPPETTLTIPQKYIDIDKAEKPGTPIFGYDQRILSVYTKDKVAMKEVTLDLIDGQVYEEYGASEHSLSAFKLPDDLNQYIKEVVF